MNLIVKYLKDVDFFVRILWGGPISGRRAESLAMAEVYVSSARLVKIGRRG